VRVFSCAKDDQKKHEHTKPLFYDSGTCITEPVSGDSLVTLATTSTKVGEGCEGINGLLSWFSLDTADSYFSNTVHRTDTISDLISDNFEVTYAEGRDSSYESQHLVHFVREDCEPGFGENTTTIDHNM